MSLLSLYCGHNVVHVWYKARHSRHRLHSVPLRDPQEETRVLHPGAALWHSQADVPLRFCPTGCSNKKCKPSPVLYHDAPRPTAQHCDPQLAPTRPGPPPHRLCRASSDQQLPGHPPQYHPPGCDEVQQPVDPDLLDATVRYSTYVGKVQLLVPTKVELVSLVVRQWRAGDRTKK